MAEQGEVEVRIPTAAWNDPQGRGPWVDRAYDEAAYAAWWRRGVLAGPPTLTARADHFHVLAWPLVPR